MGLIDIYRTSHSNIAKYAFVSAVCVTFSQIDHVLGHRATPNKCRKAATSHYALSDYNETKTQNQQQKKLQKTHKFMEVK